MDEMLIFAGSGSPRLTEQICDHLKVEPGKGETFRFPEGSIFVKVQDQVRGRQVYLIQSISFPVNDNFMELLFWIDALRRGDAASVTVILPYFSYAHNNRMDEPCTSIQARVCAEHTVVEVLGCGTRSVDEVRAFRPGAVWDSLGHRDNPLVTSW